MKAHSITEAVINSYIFGSNRADKSYYTKIPLNFYINLDYLSLGKISSIRWSRDFPRASGTHALTLPENRWIGLEAIISVPVRSRRQFLVLGTPTHRDCTWNVSKAWKVWVYTAPAKEMMVFNIVDVHKRDNYS